MFKECRPPGILHKATILTNLPIQANLIQRDPTHARLFFYQHFSLLQKLCFSSSSPTSCCRVAFSPP